MDENMDNYKDLINLMKATPKAPVPGHFTQSVMDRLADEQSLSLWQLLRQTLAEAGEISWARLARECEQGRNAYFYFLIAGFFFFFIGSVLFSSAFYIGYASRAMGFILLQSILVLMAAISLVMGSMMMATDIPGTAWWAKRAIMVYEILMILSAVLIAIVVKTTSGGLLALTCGMAGIVTGITLMKALENRKQGNNGTFTGELHNA